MACSLVTQASRATGTGRGQTLPLLSPVAGPSHGAGEQQTAIGARRGQTLPLLLLAGPSHGGGEQVLEDVDTSLGLGLRKHRNDDQDNVAKRQKRSSVTKSASLCSFFVG
ncbi:unnamed protein product [Arabis nemorensis]|uniref:Uncharacterized protein n=1 Tax=Arabis nemorensis TaxID=586526 RepID=A0A565AXI1_9BRAS|nr:unnamed protein product [Arabis nemorensis]